MSYVLKSRMLKVEQREQTRSRDLLWIDVERYTILNVYRQPQRPEVLEYVIYLSLPPNCLIGGDFNAGMRRLSQALALRTEEQTWPARLIPTA